MKKYTCIFIVTLLAAAVSCSRDTEFEAEGTATGYELLLQANVDGMATKAEVADVHDLQEDVLKTLDVYIYGTFSGDATPSVRTYHLNADDHFDAVSGKWKVASDWRTEHFVNGNDYTVYVAANSSKVKMSDYGSAAVATETLASQTITTLEALGNAIEFDYDPHAANGQGGTKPYWGANNDDGINPAWLGVHRKYTITENVTAVDSRADRYFTHEKTFLMNGTSASITPTAATGELVAPVTLSRAASKISVQVSFDPAFLTKLAAEKQWTLCGEPHWRFFNFAFSAPVFGDLSLPSAYDPTVSWFTSGADMIGYEGIDGNDLKYSSGTNKSFGFSTYSYPLTWTAATEGKHAPAIIVSVGYRDDSDTSVPEANRPVSYQAYKIPVVNPDLALYSLDRNKIYTINATISSEGSTLVTDAYATQATYSIMPWTADAVASAISERDNSYVDVIPDAIPATTNVTDVILRGNGEQTFRLHVLKPDTKSFSIAYYGISGATQSNPFAQTGTPTNYPLTGNYTDESGNDYTGCAATGAAVPYYINLDGNIRNTIGGSAIQNCFVKDGDDLLIISTALPNKGVKYMKIRVYLEGHADKYMDVNIRHYPTDALMAIEGRWSSRQSAAVVAGKITADQVIPGPEDIFQSRLALSGKVQITYNKSTYDAWVGYKSWEWVECSFAEYEAADEKRMEEGKRITREQYTPHASESGFQKITGDYTEGPFFRKGGATPVISNDKGYGYWKDATSEATSLLGSTTDPNYPTYYWGVSPESTGSTAARDYSTSSPTTHWLYGERKYVYYIGNVYYRKKYYHLNPSESIVYWPNWMENYNSTAFKVGAYYDLSNNYSTYAARIITDVKSGSNGAITTNNAGVQKVTQGINWSGTPSLSTASGYPSTDKGDWCLFFGARSGSSSMTFAAAKNSQDAGKNRYMYVLQLAESSSEYTVGRPLLREDYLSEDNVVSPAFMIASQLGSTSGNMTGKYTARWAALHCASYLEVASDGTYYMDWRLPTKAEIQTILDYQGNSYGVATLVAGSPVSGDDRVMQPVLFAKAYYALDGTAVLSNYDAISTDYTVRCVRDLTPAEVEALNN